jgi:hypothetical protein
MNNAVMYHNQAEVDKEAKMQDLSCRIITTTMQQIMDAYDEFMAELIQEAQEAY